jgi:SAM-dependent methyltransferase
VGSVPELYTRYVGPIFFEPDAADLPSRVKSMASGKALETACGTGILTRALPAALPDTVVITATDLNQPMLDFAKAQAGGEGVDWQHADAQNLSFAVVVCQFGAMFFPDKEKAYREALRVLKPGGRFLFNVWIGSTAMIWRSSSIGRWKSCTRKILRGSTCARHSAITTSPQSAPTSPPPASPKTCSTR